MHVCICSNVRQFQQVLWTNIGSVFIGWPCFVSHNLWPICYNTWVTCTISCWPLLCGWHSIGRACRSGWGHWRGGGVLAGERQLRGEWGGAEDTDWAVCEGFRTRGGGGAFRSVQSQPIDCPARPGLHPCLPRAFASGLPLRPGSCRRPSAGAAKCGIPLHVPRIIKCHGTPGLGRSIPRRVCTILGPRGPSGGEGLVWFGSRLAPKVVTHGQCARTSPA